ncbi:helix-turn-helix domain-containing protein [Bacillus velezensis]|uniref:helix-turn-helix domain-containing protein n=1 Tax=Bacillus velezensis TaxID=492670 RepID=UPI00320AAAFA
MLGVRLKELRKSKSSKLNREIKQEEVAKNIGVARTTYAMYEQDKRQPDYETLIKLADYYEVTTDYLLRDEPPEMKKKVFEDEARKILEDPDTLIAAADGKITDSILKAAQKIIAQQLEAGRKPGDIRNNKYNPDKPTDES